MHNHKVAEATYTEIHKRSASGRYPWYRTSLKPAERFLKSKATEGELRAYLPLCDRNMARKFKRVIAAFGA